MTILTSLSASKVAKNWLWTGCHKPEVKHLARLSYEYGLDGVVCSAQKQISLKVLPLPNFNRCYQVSVWLMQLKDDQTRVYTGHGF